MPDPTDNQAASPKGTPPRDTGGDTAATGQKLLQSANGDKSTPPAGTDHGQAAPAAAEGDVHSRLVDDYLRSASDTSLPRPGQASESAADLKPAPENISKGFAELEQNLTRLGVGGEGARDVSKEFESLRKQGKLPEDLSGIKSCLDRLNRDSKNGTLTEEAADTILRLVSASLEGKVKLLTPETGAKTAGREYYNRENPDYVKGDNLQQGDTNCRACTGAFIMNEKLSDRAMLLEYDRLLDKIEAGKSGKVLLVPIEQGIPKMTADTFVENHGATHTGSAGTVYTTKQQEAFQKNNKPVATYISNGLNAGGFSEMSLPGGFTANSIDASRAMRTPGMYVLEHPTEGGSVNGHVTAATVDESGKVTRHDTQIPDNHLQDWPINAVYKVTTGEVAVEEKTSHRNSQTGEVELNTRVLNPDGTVRDFNFSKQTGQLQSITDVDGRSYFRNPEGKWQTVKEGITVDAPFKNVEYLGTTEGTRFTFNDHTITERPNGKAEISVPNTLLHKDGAPVKLHGADAKVSDLVSKIERNADGSFTVEFQDKKTTVRIKPETDNAKASETRSLQGLETQLKRLEQPGTIGGDSLNQAIVGKIQELTADGSTPESAVLKLLKPGVNVDRVSQISEAMRQAGMQTDLQTVTKIDTIMTEMKLPLADVGKAKAVLDKGQELLAKSQSDKSPLTERQAFEIAILQATENPAKPGKNYTEASARALVKKADEVRVDARAENAPLSHALELLRLREQYAGMVDDSFVNTASNRPPDAKSKANDIRIINNSFAGDPQKLADAEATFQRLGGAADGLHLMDALAINKIPRLKDNPEFASEIFTEAKRIRSNLLLPATKYRAEDYLKMGLLVHDAKQKGTPLKTSQIEDAYKRSITEERRAADAERERQAATDSPSAKKTAVEKPAGDATANDTGSASPKVETVEPTADAFRGFREKIAALDSLPPAQMHDEYFKTALRDTAVRIHNKSLRPAFASTSAKVVESDALPPGESKLAISHKGKTLEVKSLESGGALHFVTADGTKVPVEECKVEMQCGKGSSKAQIAREALVRSAELKDLFEGKQIDAAHRMAADHAVKSAFDHGDAHDRAGHGVAERVAKLGAFELHAGREPVLLTNSGVTFGGKPEVTFETLVKETLKDKREHLKRLEKSKGTGENAELDGQIKILNDQITDLDHLSRNVHRPETIAKLVETIKKHATTEEIERIRAEHAAGGGGRFKAGVTKAGTYSLVAAFVAQMIFRESSQQDASIEYAPTTSRGL